MTIELSFTALADRRGETFLVSREGMDPVKLELVEVEDLRDPKRKLPTHIRHGYCSSINRRCHDGRDR